VDLLILRIWLDHIIVEVVFESSYRFKAAEELSEGIITKGTVNNAKVGNRELGILLIWIPVQNRWIKVRCRQNSILGIELAASHQMSSEVCDRREGKE
jgi:hypothetical protein